MTECKVDQTGINDCPNVLKDLFQKLLKIRVRPYYLYQCDLSEGIEHFRTSVATGMEIIESLRGYTSGMAIPSYIVKPGDVVQLTDRSRASLRCKAALEAAESRGFPEWISVDVKEGKGTFKAMPQRSELSPTLNEGLVIELYSK